MELAAGLGALQLHGHGRLPQNLQAVGIGGGVEGQRQAIVAALIRREVGAEPERNVLALQRAGGQRRGDQAVFAQPAVGFQSPIAETEGQRLDLVGRRGPAMGTHPLAGAFEILWRRRYAILQIEGALGLVHDPGVDILEPVVPPAQRLLQEADRRIGNREVRILVHPRPQQRLLGAGEVLHHPRDRIDVRIPPAADHVDRRFDIGVALADRAMLPVVVPVLVVQPGFRQQRHVVEPVLPHLAPAFAHQRRVGHGGGKAQHGRRPAEILQQHVAALVVDVVGVAIVGGAQRDDRLERLRPERRHLQPVEAAPGDAHHAELAVAPGLAGDPVDHFQRVGLLLRGVLVEHQAIGFAVATHVDAHAGVAVTGKVGVGQLVANRRAIPLAIGQVFENRRDRIRLGIFLR